MGPDGLAPKLFIETKDFISDPLYLLFKKSLHKTVILHDWKLATVTPILRRVTEIQPKIIHQSL